MTTDREIWRLWEAPSDPRLTLGGEIVPRLVARDQRRVQGVWISATVREVNEMINISKKYFHMSIKNSASLSL